MRKFITGLSFAAAIVFGTLISSANASITYNIHDTIGVFTVTGTVTTDGTIGSVGAANFENWNISLSKSGSTVFTLIKGVNSFADGALEASATALTFDHEVLSTRFGIIAFGGSNVWCVGATCDSNHVPASYIVTTQGSDFALREGVVEYGTVAVATVPEPSTWALMLIGFAGVGYLGFSKSRRSRAIRPAALAQDRHRSP